MTVHPYSRIFTGKTAAPTVNDDISLGYEVGDIWVDETNDKTYQAVDITDGAAVWNKIPVNASDMLMARIGTPTYSTVQHMQDIFHSSGWSSGGAISDAGGATINVTAGTGFIRATDSDVAPILFFDWPTSNGLAITANTIRYIGVEYNAGTPQVTVRTTQNWNYNTDFPLGIVVNDAGTLHIEDDKFAVGNHAGKMIQREYQTMPLARDERTGGIILGETGTRNITVSAGALWDRLNRYAISAIDTSGAGRFDAYYRDGAGGFTVVSAQSQWPNTQYDDGTGTLATMTAARYANLWFYIESDGALVMLYGRNQYTTLAQAQAGTIPTTVPNRITATGKLIGRLIFQKSAATVSEITSVFTGMLSPTGATTHNDLAGLNVGDYQHLSSADNTEAVAFLNGGTGTHTAMDAHIASTANPHAVTAAQAGAAPSTAKGVMVFGGHGAGATVPATTTYYIIPFISGLDASARSVAIPTAGVIKNLYVRLASAQPASGNLVITIYDFTTSASTGITVTIAAGAASATYTDLVHTYTHTAGNLIQIQILNNATEASGVLGTVAFELEYSLR